MFSLPNFEQVSDDLGDKVIHAFSAAVAHTARDLKSYRSCHPGWVADSTERGLANWIHDRLWTHMVRELQAVEEAGSVSVHDREPFRELWVGHKYKLRAKRHDSDGRVSTYPTQTALEFYTQAPMIEGLEEVRLAVGYEWNTEERDIVQPVLSLRTDKETLVWKELLPVVALPDEQTEDLDAQRDQESRPTKPQIDLPFEERDDNQETGTP